jgi:lactoylglutathione lyase
VSATRPFSILGIQQIAVGGASKEKLRGFWVDLLGTGPFAVEVDLMQPLDVEKKPRVDMPALNHVGLWVDDLAAAVPWLIEQGLRFTPGGIRKGAAGHDVCFIHPVANDEFPLSAQGVLVELVQAPEAVIKAYKVLAEA